MEISGESGLGHRGLIRQDPRWLPKSLNKSTSVGVEWSSVKSPQLIVLVSQHDRYSSYMAILINQINHGGLLWCLCTLTTLTSYTQSDGRCTKQKLWCQHPKFSFPLPFITLQLIYLPSTHTNYCILWPKLYLYSSLYIIILPELKSVVSKRYLISETMSGKEMELQIYQVVLGERYARWLKPFHSQEVL